jgi:hypothetical protein
VKFKIEFVSNNQHFIITLSQQFTILRKFYTQTEQKHVTQKMYFVLIYYRTKQNHVQCLTISLGNTLDLVLLLDGIRVR